MAPSILKAPEHQLRALLKLLLSIQDPKLHTKVKELYSDVVQLDQSPGDKKRKADAEDSAEESKKKRVKLELVHDINICDQCEETFLESENDENACRYHPEELEMDEDASIWEEWEDWREGDRYHPSNREEYPEGFTYPCCKGKGDAEGCEVGRHVGRSLGVGK